MKILFATSECAPFSKSGGLADVAFSLPPALKKAGNQVAIITPLYQGIREKFGKNFKLLKETGVRVGFDTQYCGLLRGELDGVTVYFVDNEGMFNRPKLYGYDDDAYRFAFFCRAIVELLEDLEFLPEILHCNDWETALAIIYLKEDQVWRSNLQGMKTVYTIHNIAYQGQFGAAELGRTFGLADGWYEGGLGYVYEGRRDINLMKGAMLMADAVSTVSPTYARELHDPAFGCGQQGVADAVEYKLYGVLNGINMDHYDPTKDTRIPYAFSVDDMSGKAKCKASIQEKFGLTQEAHWPLLASVARLVEQKGIELVKEVLPGLMDMGVQLIVFGQGEQQYIDYFNWAKERWPGQLGFSCDYTEQMASEIFAGADMYLMPSRFEPCGLSQMMAMRYGTVPIVHETGGLKDSVRPYSDFDGIGDGFSFRTYSGKALYQAILHAVKVYIGQEDIFAILRKRGMTKDFSWDKSAQHYMQMYGEIVESSQGEELSFDEAFKKLKRLYRQIDNKNRKKYRESFSDDYCRVIQIQITGRGAGVMYLKFTNNSFEVEPYNYDGADARIVCSFDNLMGMAKGKISPRKLFMTGQLKMSGNIVKGTELRNLLGLDVQEG